MIIWSFAIFRHPRTKVFVCQKPRGLCITCLDKMVIELLVWMESRIHIRPRSQTWIRVIYIIGLLSKPKFQKESNLYRKTKRYCWNLFVEFFLAAARDYYRWQEKFRDREGGSARWQPVRSLETYNKTFCTGDFWLPS